MEPLRGTTLKIVGIKQMRKLAKKLARRSEARVYALIGDLGSGKTTFVQAFLKALGVKERITSPTFLIIKSYKLQVKSDGRVYHIDCYRLHKPKELLDLGFKKIIADPKNIVLIEWADRVKRLIPKSAVWIRFEHGEKKNEREVTMKHKT